MSDISNIYEEIVRDMKCAIDCYTETWNGSNLDAPVNLPHVYIQFLARRCADVAQVYLIENKPSSEATTSPDEIEWDDL